MELFAINRVVAEWAATQPLVLRAWLFGSRVRGEERPDSDIDVAIEVQALPTDSDAYTTFACESDLLRASLQALLPIKVDLQWYGSIGETPTIHAGLQRSSLLAYSASSAVNHDVRL